MQGKGKKILKIYEKKKKKKKKKKKAKATLLVDKTRGLRATKQTKPRPGGGGMSLGIINKNKNCVVVVEGSNLVRSGEGMKNKHNSM